MFNKKTTLMMIVVFVLAIILGFIVYAGFSNNWWKENKSDNTQITNTPTPGATEGPALIAPANENTTTPLPTTESYSVKVYFSKHPDSDNDPSKVFAVDRTNTSLGVATFAMKELIKGPTSSESTSGFYSPLKDSLTGTSNCDGEDFKISLNSKGSSYEQGTATLQFCKTTSLAGDLTGVRIKSEIEGTLKQFSSIKKVIILSQNGSCFDDFSGLNQCLK